MIATLAHYIDLIAKIVEVIGVLIMFFGLFFAFYRGIRLTSGFNHETYIEVRQTVGKSILLGLEVLIAADYGDCRHRTDVTQRPSTRFYRTHSDFFELVTTSRIRRQIPLAKRKYRTQKRTKYR
ncbi:DUF1622 domain-containing protein [Psychrobacter sp. WY6]|uniref:DUF1622 domain-containing protein n=1 Tax=Psychrobacter sp. WY6 TaxID=2708350 RepID=UPI0032E7F6EC